MQEGNVMGEEDREGGSDQSRGSLGKQDKAFGFSPIVMGNQEKSLSRRAHCLINVFRSLVWPLCE